MGQFLVTDQLEVGENTSSLYTIFPNPSLDGQINLDLNDYSGEVKIVDITGRQVFSSVVEKHSTLNLNLESGVYYLIDEIGNSLHFIVQ